MFRQRRHATAPIEAFTLSNLRREFDWHVKRALPWSGPKRKRTMRGVSEVLATFSGSQLRRYTELADAYDLSAWPRVCTAREYRYNLYYLDVGDRYLRGGDATIRLGGRAIDVGARNWYYAPALHALQTIQPSTQPPPEGLDLGRRGRAVFNPTAIEKILRHLGIPHRAPARAPPRPMPASLPFTACGSQCGQQGTAERRADPGSVSGGVRTRSVGSGLRAIRPSDCRGQDGEPRTRMAIRPDRSTEKMGLSLLPANGKEAVVLDPMT